MELFGASALFFLLGGLASLCLGSRPAANTVGAGAALLGSLAGLAGVLSGPFSASLSVALPWGLPLGGLSLGLDAVSRLFLLPVYVLGAACAVSGAAALGHGHTGKHALGPHWFFYNILLLGLALVMTARDAVCFLVAWEIMSVAPFFLVSFHDDEAEVREASWIYLVAAHLGAVCVIAFFAWFWGQAGSTGFAALAQAASTGRLAAPSALFLLALVGFGAKAGFVPFHVWLPEAHPAAPSHVSAVLSGAMINAGVYGLLRSLELLGPIRPWWGWTLVCLGLVTGLFAILQALAQGNIKRLLAYSSVENMGVICLGLGLWLVGRAMDQPAITVLGLAGALFHVLSHAAFKGMLFLCAGEVLHSVGSVRLAHLGGLGKRLPLVAAAFALGAAGIAGLPPLAGFAGELTLALAMVQGIDLPGLLPRVGMAAALVGLAAIGGFALAAFAKAYGLGFLGEPRTPAAARAEAPGFPALAPVAFLALCCAAAGLGAPALFVLAAKASLALPGADPSLARATLAQAQSILLIVVQVSLGLLALTVALLLVRRGLLIRAGLRREPTWGCGYTAPTARMQYTGASFVEPTAKVLGSVMGLRRRLDMAPGYFPARAALTSAAPDRLKGSIFTPAFEAVARACDALKVVQHGRVHLYILYVLATVVILLAWKL